MNENITEFSDSLLPTGSLGKHKSIQASVCAWCGKEATDFRDALSRKEYAISALCQACQDDVFPTGESDE